jgi:hypothetical protein
MKAILDFFKKLFKKLFSKDSAESVNMVEEKTQEVKVGEVKETTPITTPVLEVEKDKSKIKKNKTIKKVVKKTTNRKK